MSRERELRKGISVGPTGDGEEGERKAAADIGVRLGDWVWRRGGSGEGL